MIDQKTGQVGFGRALKDYFKGYVEFRGRTTRAGYWWVQLALWLVWLAMLIWIVTVIVKGFTTGLPGAGIAAMGVPLILAIVLFLATFLPSLALEVRRYRDVGLRGRGTAVLLGLNYVIAVTMTLDQYQQVSGVYTRLEEAMSQQVLPTNGFGLFLNFVSIALGVFLFVLTVLPTDTMLTTSQNGFVRFFIRERESETSPEN